MPQLRFPTSLRLTALLLTVILFLPVCAQKLQRTVYCMGETVLDILFRGSDPIAANAGGSLLNSAVSLGRAGVEVQFIGEVGNDSTGTISSIS
jgi:hypothetical protein